ncbi:hypothetical protein E1301_Tti018050 [Triplophysa tibetana]|uniref:Uncharacterized protein n=1 Tax=Triplophysa tibetana TaxID=1572043 RepID=A0A5A9NFN0_9TELE|nr:hypothetical protein E1301_Tti018050 [Triplophysa tibetana]
MSHRGVRARQTINHSLQLSLCVFLTHCLEHVDIATGMPVWVLDVGVIELRSPAECWACTEAQPTGANLDLERALRNVHDPDPSLQDLAEAEMKEKGSLLRSSSVVFAYLFVTKDF